MPKLNRALRGPGVVSQQPTESFTAFDRTAPARDIGRRIDEPIANSLVIAFAVVVRDVLPNGLSNMPFSDRNDPS